MHPTTQDDIWQAHLTTDSTYASSRENLAEDLGANLVGHLGRMAMALGVSKAHPEGREPVPGGAVAGEYESRWLRDRAASPTAGIVTRHVENQQGKLASELGW